MLRHAVIIIINNNNSFSFDVIIHFYFDVIVLLPIKERDVISLAVRAQRGILEHSSHRDPRGRV